MYYLSNFDPPKHGGDELIKFIWSNWSSEIAFAIDNECRPILKISFIALLISLCRFNNDKFLNASETTTILKCVSPDGFLLCILDSLWISIYDGDRISKFFIIDIAIGPCKPDTITLEALDIISIDIKIIIFVLEIILNSIRYTIVFHNEIFLKTIYCRNMKLKVNCLYCIV